MTQTSADERGVSEVVGVILLFGLVMAGVAILLVSGTQLQQGVEEQSRMESAQMAVEQFDRELSSMAFQGGERTLDAVDFPDNAGTVGVEQATTRVTMSFNGSAACSASVKLGSVEYVNDDGDRVAYEAGGVWRETGDEMTMVQPPDLSYNDGTVRFSAEIIQGEVASTDELSADHRADASAKKTENFRRDMVTTPSGGICGPRENVTLTVESVNHEVWEGYLREEFPSTADFSVDAAAGRVTVVLDEQELAAFDSDSDGVTDPDDNCPLTYNPSQNDNDDDAYTGDTTKNEEVAGRGGDACDSNDDGSLLDNDAVPDTSDNCRMVGNPSQDDLDGDGVGDKCDIDRDGDDHPNSVPPVYDQRYKGSDVATNPKDNCPDTYNPAQTDTDGDGAGDACDPDDDDPNDGSNPAEPNDGTDNCPKVPNPSQTDTDGGGRGDACDPDDDGDDYYDPGYSPDPGESWAGGPDNCPKVPNPSQTDSNGDGVGDACDPDSDKDGDGVKDVDDNCPFTANPSQENTDKNVYGGTDNPRGDACDPDDDGDGYYDPGYTGPTGEFDGGPDNCPKTYNPNQYDKDNDGQGAACDPDEAPGPGLPSHSGDFVDVQSVDATNYRAVSAYVSVDTPPAENGNLDEDDFQVFENGQARPVVDVAFTAGTQVDIVFVFDDSASMGQEISDMKSHVTDFANDLDDAGLNTRYALVSFRDSYSVDQGFTGSLTQFEQSVNALTAAGGNDPPEDSHDAIYAGTQLNFRPSAQKVVIHVTDAPSHPSNGDSPDGHQSSHGPVELARTIHIKGITYFTVSPPEECIAVGTTCSHYDHDQDGWFFGDDTPEAVWNYREVAAAVGGDIMNINQANGFEQFLDDIEDDLTSRYRVIYPSCMAGDGSERDVHVYADSQGQTSRDKGSYIAPSDGSSDVCPSTAVDPESDDDLPSLAPDPPSDTDAALPTDPTCDKGETPDADTRPDDPADVDDPDGDGDPGCYPTAAVDWPDPSPKDPHTTLVTVRVDVVEVDDE